MMQPPPPEGDNEPVIDLEPVDDGLSSFTQLTVFDVIEDLGIRGGFWKRGE